MSRSRTRWRPHATALALALLVAGCSDDSGSPAATDRSTSSTAAETTTTEASTTTTAAPRALTADEVRSVLLQPEDVPLHLALEDKEPPPGWQATEPPACGEQISGDGPGEVRATTMFVEPDGFLAFESIAEHTPGAPEDLEPMREAIAGPCAEPFRHITTEGIDTEQQMTLLGDPDIGDDALAARFDIRHTLDGWPVHSWAYMVYFRRGDVSIQVQAITGAVPDADLTGPDISLEEVERLARRIDDRVVALQAAR